MPLAEIAITTFLAFATAARDRVLQAVGVASNVIDDLRLLVCPDFVFVFLPAEVLRAMEEVGDFSLLRNLEFEAGINVSFMNAQRKRCGLVKKARDSFHTYGLQRR